MHRRSPGETIAQIVSNASLRQNRRGRSAAHTLGWPDGLSPPRPGTVGPPRSECGEYRERIGADLLCTGATGTAAAVGDRPCAVSRGVAVDRVAGESPQGRHPACRLEHALGRPRDAACRSYRPGGTGDPEAAAGAGARLSLRADLSDDALLLACAALRLGPLVWRPQDDDLTLGLRAGTSLVAPDPPMDWRASQGVDGLCG